MNDAFEIMKTFLAADVLMAHPNYNIPFFIHTNAFDYQMVAKIIQWK